MVDKRPDMQRRPDPKINEYPCTSPEPGTAPIRTPNPTDADSHVKSLEVPKVGSQDAPGG